MTAQFTLKIIGVGNPLMGDDGLGVAAVERLSSSELPPEVEVLDGGTGGLTLLHLMEGAEKVIFIDAVEMGAEPGTIRRLELGEILGRGEVFSPHGTGLVEVLSLGMELGLLPDVVLYGMEPLCVELRRELSAVVAVKLPALLRSVLIEVGGAQCATAGGRRGVAIAEARHS